MVYLWVPSHFSVPNIVSLPYLLYKCFFTIVSETAPVELKGPAGVMTQLFITVGIMVPFIFGLAIPEAPKNNTRDGEAWIEYAKDPYV
jgi:Sugar (and other) transporter